MFLTFEEIEENTEIRKKEQHIRRFNRKMSKFKLLTLVSLNISQGFFFIAPLVFSNIQF